MKNIYKSILAVVGTCATLTGCSDDFLAPDPLSFYAPDNTFTTASGLQAAMAQTDRQLMLVNKSEGNLDAKDTQFLLSDIFIPSMTDNASQVRDFARELVPSRGTYSSNVDGTRMHSIIYYWRENYAGIKYANTVIQYAQKVEGLDPTVRDTYLGRAYFHRAFRYFSLVNMFNNVPLITRMPESPKRNYSSTSREAILKMLMEDMEKAVEMVPDQAPASYTADYPGGYVNKAACRMLLAKIYMANYEYQKALDQLNIVIDQSGYSLMTESFGANTTGPDYYVASVAHPITRNVIWDLARGKNVFDKANKETILGLVNQGQKIEPIEHCRILTPFVWDTNGGPKTEDGYPAVDRYSVNNKNFYPEGDWRRAYGRGIAAYRPTTWYQYDVWSIDGKEETGDLRHSHETGNWARMEDMRVNNHQSKHKGEYLKLYAEDGTLLCGDTIRTWFNFPLYKMWEYDYNNDMDGNSTEWRGARGEGGYGNIYLYRLAEAYLLRAEVKLYLGQDGTEDVNIVRRRAKCTNMYTHVTIDDVFDERARELFLEEYRHDEMVRASFCIAQSGIADGNGNTYTIAETVTPSTPDTSREGGSWWYQRLMRTCPDAGPGCKHLGYNNGVVYDIKAPVGHPEYWMGKHNMFCPIPEFAISDNDLGTLAQNFGYSGYDPNVKIFTDWHEAVADELK